VVWVRLATKESRGIVGILLVFMSLSTFAAGFSAKIRHYDVTHGLPSDQVYDVLSDKYGYLWFATDAGVCRYDGYTFKNYTTADGLTSNSVFSLYEDSVGNIWCLGLSEAICYIDNGVVREYKFNKQLKAWNIGAEVKKNLTFQGDTLFAYVFGRGYLWLSNKGNGLYYEYPFGKNTNDTGYLHRLKTGSDGKITVASESVNSENDTAYIKKMNRPGYTRYIDVLTVPWTVCDRRQKYNDKDGMEIWANDESVYYFQNSVLQRKVFTDNKLVCVLKQTNGDYWMAYENDGVYLYNDGLNEGSASDHFFGKLTITAIEEDYEGGIWFSTLTKGVYYLPPGLDFVKEVPHQLPNTRVISLAASEDELFIGYENGAIWKIADETTAVQLKGNRLETERQAYNPLFFDQFKNELITIDELVKLYNDSKSSLVRKFSAQRKFNYVSEQIVPPVFVTALSDKNGGYYWATSCGLLHYKVDGTLDPQFYKYKKVAGAIIPSWCFRIDAFHQSAGAIDFVTSNEGIFRLSGDTMHFLGDTIDLLAGRFSCIVSDSLNNTYFGSNGKGLVVWKQDSIFTVDNKQGLLGNEVRALCVEQNQVVWVGTNTGVNRLSWGDDGQLTNIPLTTNHGLSASRINAMLTLGSDLFLGTDKGVVRLEMGCPAAIRAKPRVYLDTFSVHGKPIPISQRTVVLDASENRLSFSFTSLAYKDLAGQIYEYQLEGLGNTWSRTTKRSVQYEFLPPGQYVFKVRSLNNRGRISDTVTQAFVIRKPFWLQWWFFTLVLILLGCVTILMVRQREQSIRKKMEDRRRIVELELKALRSQMNPHFTYNTMSAIQQYIMNNTNVAASDYIADFASLIRKVLENSKEEVISLKAELETLALYLKLEKKRFESSLSYFIDVDTSIDVDAFYIPTMVIQPYIENAILHGILPGQREGEITIDVRQKGKGVLITLEDNGIGRKRSEEIKKDRFHKKSGLGMQITGERLNLIQKQLNAPYNVHIEDITNDQGTIQGTRVELFFSVNLNPYD
jgi:ligand-binding sensor domain-containing protein